MAAFIMDFLLPVHSSRGLTRFVHWILLALMLVLQPLPHQLISLPFFLPPRYLITDFVNPAGISNRSDFHVPFVSWPVECCKSHRIHSASGATL